MSQTLMIKAGQKKYEAFIERGLMDGIPGKFRSMYPESRFAVITDENVYRIYGKRMQDGFDGAGLDTYVIAVKPGEGSKSLRTYADILSCLARMEYSRSDVIVALGGGVAGDLAGFVAATYLRGIRYVQVPTTLLAQIDSSVGGKTGVNLPEGKNLAGAYHHPEAVYIDIGFLETLKEEDFAGGMAEMIKYAMIKDNGILAVLENETMSASSRSLDALILKCLEIKREVVAADEKDKGERMLLNFGHTIGHALERICAASGTPMTHGQAVSRGMAAITYASERMGNTKKGTAKRLVSLLLKAGLPDSISGFDKQEILQGIFVDKKNIADTLNIVLLREPGISFISPVSPDTMKDYL